jgi:putative spermidine/putrescine transport system substrate-binding protein
MTQRTPRRSTRRDFLKTGAAAVAGTAILGFPRVGRAQATELVLGTNGGTWYDHWYEGSFRHFEKAHGVKIVPFKGSSFELLQKALAERRGPTMDLTASFGETNARGRMAGLWANPNSANLPIVAQCYPFVRDKDGWAPAPANLTWSIVYNTEKVKTPPQSFKEFADPKLKGQVMMGGTIHQAMILLSFAQTWSGDQHNIDAGFAAVKQVMPNVSTFFGLTSDAQNKFQQGLGSVACWFAETTGRLRDMGVPLRYQIPTEGAWLYPHIYHPINGTKKMDLCEKFINFTLGEESQLNMAKLERFTPVNRTVKVPAEIVKEVLTVDQMQKMNQFDWQFVGKDMDGWFDRWNREITPLLK